MKELIDNIQKSIYSPEYYHELLSRPASYSWKYYWSLAMFIAVFMTAVSALPLVPLVTKTLHALPGNMLAYYPDELDVRIDKGGVSTNVTEPYFLPLPAAIKEEVGSTSETVHLGVIDTYTPFSLDQFRAYRSAFWVGADSIAFLDNNKSIRILMLTKDMSYVVNETNVGNILKQVEPYFKFVAPVLVLLIFVAMLISFAINLIYLLFGALLVLVLGMLMKRKWTYFTAYRLCLHATTLPLFVTLLFMMLPLGGELPFFGTFLMLGVIYMNLRHTPAPEAPASIQEN